MNEQIAAASVVKAMVGVSQYSGRTEYLNNP